MRVPLSWLRDYVDFDLTADELVDLLSLHSQEVDGVERMGVLDGEVVVGEVLEFESHPNADRLSVAKVDLGGQIVQIVAGAPNPFPGARVPVVLPGSTVAGVGKLKKAKLRGLESCGMMMSERELGISGDHGGILLLDESYEVGRPLEEYFPIGETVLEIDVMPNRPDLWGVIGMARELAAILKTTFHIPELDVKPGGKPTADFDLRVEAEDLCTRYDLRRVSNLTPGEEAPLVMRRRVYAAGMRPINAVVDGTNYVMLETGQPIHAFDAARVHEGIVVRRAQGGEKITLLDGSTRALDEEMLVIADDDRGLVIAGIMGAEDAEVSDQTTDTLIEVATFDGRNILETSQRLGLRTDASGRFERGLDPNMVDFTMERVVGLLTGHPQGRAASDTLSHYPEPVAALEVPMRLGRAKLLLGMPVAEREAAERLNFLGCEVRREEGRLLAKVPTFRRDLRREVDLIEEVGRLIGLDKVPDALPATALPGGLTPDQRKVRLLRRLLADIGLTEAITYPFAPDRWQTDLNLTNGNSVPTMPELRNPLSEEASSLRPMLLPSLLDAAARNRSFGSRGGALFEVGRVFEPDPPPEERRDAAIHFRMTGRSDGDAGLLVGMKEPARVGVVLFGTIRPKGWNGPERRAGFYEARGIVERLVPGARFEPHAQSFLHPGRSARVLFGGAEAGWVGELHPEVLEKFELDGWPVAAFELDPAFCQPDPETRFEPFVNVPAVSRDLAIILDRQILVGEMLAAVERLRSPILVETRVFDVYEGSQVPEDKKSVALGFTFQGEETLTDAAVNEELGRISSELKDRFGAQARGS